MIRKTQIASKEGGRDGQERWSPPTWPIWLLCTKTSTRRLGVGNLDTMSRWQQQIVQTAQPRDNWWTICSKPYSHRTNRCLWSTICDMILTWQSCQFSTFNYIQMMAGLPEDYKYSDSTSCTTYLAPDAPGHCFTPNYPSVAWCPCPNSIHNSSSS